MNLPLLTQDNLPTTANTIVEEAEPVAVGFAADADDLPVAVAFGTVEVNSDISKKAAFVLVDIETLGLDHAHDPVIEFGVRVVDKYLSELARKTWLVLPGVGLASFQGMFRESAEVVREMHTKNGLYEEICDTMEGQHANYSANFQSLMAWKWLTEDLGLKSGVYPMTGSSVHFDRRFIEEQLSIFGGFFSHRNIDISSIKELCKIFNPEIYAAMKNDPRFSAENKTHRPQEDIDATLAELQFYIDNFLFVEMFEDMDGQEELSI